MSMVHIRTNIGLISYHSSMCAFQAFDGIILYLHFPLPRFLSTPALHQGLIGPSLQLRLIFVLKKKSVKVSSVPYIILVNEVDLISFFSKATLLYSNKIELILFLHVRTLPSAQHLVFYYIHSPYTISLFNIHSSFLSACVKVYFYFE